jgi:hypothetical protein
MMRSTIRNFYWLYFSSAFALSLVCDGVFAATGIPLNFSEERNLPSWVHLGTDPACSGFADDCTTVDPVDSTGFTFSAGTTGTGGEPGFNILTLPDGTTGLSGQALTAALPGTDSFGHFRTLSGVPDSFRLWVVVDNGVDPNFNSQSRLRVNIRNTTGPPAFTPEGSADSTAEALPTGTDALPHRLIEGNSDPNANNGTADAWSFLLSGVTEHDYITFQMTSNGTDKAAIAGFMIEPLTTTGARGVTWESANSLINTTNYTGLADYHWFPSFGIPEPSSALLIVIGALGLNASRWRRRS